MIPYTKLGDDLDNIIRSFETNPAVTGWQRSMWQSSGKRKAITHAMFGHDHEKALAFEDGTKVGSFAKNSARHFWDYAGWHVFPPVEDVVRFCLFMHLDLYRTLALVLKAEWEHFIAHDLNEWRADGARNLTDILLDGDEHALSEAVTCFKPRGDIYDLLRDLASRHAPASGSRGPFLEGHTPSTFANLVQMMTMGRYHLLPTESAELAEFAARARDEFILLMKGTIDEQQAYTLKKTHWVSLRQKLEELYVLIENQRLKNAHTRREWLALFGEEVIAIQEAVLEQDRWSVREDLAKVNHDWTREDIERGVKENEKKRQLELTQLRTDAALAHHLVRVSGETGTGGRTVEADEYLKECKTVLRQIRRLLHPDRLVHHPSYGHLTSGQKERLKKMLLAALEVRPEELGYPEGYMLHDMRSLEGLKGSLSRIEAILGNPGIDTDERLTIQGETLPEKLEWLKREIAILEDEMLAAKAELQALFEDDDRVKERAILNDPASHERTRANLRTCAEEARQDIEQRERAFDALFDHEGRRR